MPSGHSTGAEFDGIRYQPHGGFRWENELFLGDILLQDVVLGRARELVEGHTLFLRDGTVKGQQYGRGTVDGHARAHRAQVYPVEEDLHVLQAAHRNAAPSDLARTERVI